jgi:NADH-ubiquinone oxidoreductase chain 6
MNEYLIVISNNMTNGYKIEFLEVLSIVALILGTIVIIIKNPIGSLMCLIGLFGSIAVYLILKGLNFIGFSYLIVYIGAVSILFLFILMLIDIRTSELSSNNVNSIPLALLVIIVLNYTWLEVSPTNIDIGQASDSVSANPMLLDTFNKIVDFWLSLLDGLNKNVANIMFVTSNNWDGYITDTNHAAALGMVLYSTFNIWLILTSIILLLAMVGAILITIK